MISRTVALILTALAALVAFVLGAASVDAEVLTVFADGEEVGRTMNAGTALEAAEALAAQGHDAAVRIGDTGKGLMFKGK